jgi:hypothetical protein
MDNSKVKIGRGSSDQGAYHRAIDVASQLEAAGLWDGESTIVIHDAYDTHRKVQFTPVVGRVGIVNIHAGVHDLVKGQDYEIVA